MKIGRWREKERGDEGVREERDRETDREKIIQASMEKEIDKVTKEWVEMKRGMESDK